MLSQEQQDMWKNETKYLRDLRAKKVKLQNGTTTTMWMMRTISTTNGVLR